MQNDSPEDKEDHKKALEKITGLTSSSNSKPPSPQPPSQPQNTQNSSPAESNSGPRPGQGRIFSVQGPVVDVSFENLVDIPALYDVIEAFTFDHRRILLQCAEHLNSKVVRCVSLMDTLNLQLNAVCHNTFQPISIPIGDECFGRVMDATGRPLDNGGEIKTAIKMPIRKITKQIGFDLKRKKAEKAEVLETGMKYIDMLFPLVKGSKTGILGGAGCGKTVVILELINISSRRMAAHAFLRESANAFVKETNFITNWPNINFFRKLCLPSVRWISRPVLARKS